MQRVIEIEVSPEALEEAARAVTADNPSGSRAFFTGGYWSLDGSNNYFAQATDGHLRLFTRYPNDDHPWEERLLNHLGVPT